MHKMEKKGGKGGREMEVKVLRKSECRGRKRKEAKTRGERAKNCNLVNS